ncbi:MAG: hypothetical protein WC505_04410 [Patescibacteria group bacterium]
MPTIKKNEPHIIYRLVLSKDLYKSGLELSNTDVDVFSFSRGLIALHDALDNFTGAIATNLSISKQQSFLIETLNDIEKYEKRSNKSFILKSKNELGQLNAIRNNIKHQGITPNIKQTKTLLGPIVSFFHEYSQYYFGLEWEFISLADLIKKESVREELRKVEELIKNKKYKDALDKLAIIKFQIFDEELMRIKLDPRYDLSPPSEETRRLRASYNIFPGQDDGLLSDLNDRAKFLERGISRDLISKFEDLTAKVGVNNAKDWKYILQHGYSWGEINWTREIAIFCFDFLTEAIIKNQGREYSVKQKWFSEIYRIRALDDLDIFDKDHNHIYKMAKGEERDASAMGRVASKWEIFDSSDRILNLYNEGDGKREVMGFFNKGDEAKIEFVKTSQYTRDESGNWILLKEIPE